MNQTKNCWIKFVDSEFKILYLIFEHLIMYRTMYKVLYDNAYFEGFCPDPNFRLVSPLSTLWRQWFCLPWFPGGVIGSRIKKLNEYKLQINEKIKWEVICSWRTFLKLNKFFCRACPSYYLTRFVETFYFLQSSRFEFKIIYILINETICREITVFLLTCQKLAGKPNFYSFKLYDFWLQIWK